MNISEYVVSLELAKKLKEEGYPQESLFLWVNSKLYYGEDRDGFGIGQIIFPTREIEIYAAPTVGELLEDLKEKGIEIWYSPLAEEWGVEGSYNKVLQDGLAELWLKLQEGYIK